jgi:plasmid maintenance system antidote protein VapI
MVPQRKSTKSENVEQLCLLSPSRKPSAPVDVAYLLGLGSLRRVLRYSMSLRDLEPKAVYEQLDMDKATWSRIENGGMSFPADDLEKFRQIVGNDAVIMWLVHQSGYDLTSLRKAQDDKDKEIEQLKAELADTNRALNLLVGRMRQ